MARKIKKKRILLLFLTFVLLVSSTVFVSKVILNKIFISNFEDNYILDINGSKISPTRVKSGDKTYENKQTSVDVSVPVSSKLNLPDSYNLYSDGIAIAGDVTYLADGKYTLEVTKGDYEYYYNLNVDNEFHVQLDDTYAYTAGYLSVNFIDLNSDEKVETTTEFKTSEKLYFQKSEMIIPIDYDNEVKSYSVEFKTAKTTVKNEVSLKSYEYRESRFNVDESVVEESSEPADEKELALYEAANTKITKTAYYKESGFKQPSVGYTTGDFGDIRYINGDTKPTKIHYGVDYASKLNTPIYSSADGVVAFVGFLPVYGNVIVVDHGQGITSHYFHLETTLVEVGDTVDNDTQIAGMGTTGFSTGVHLHFEIHINGVITNPYFWLGQ